jgi:HEAT repeat protein
MSDEEFERHLEAEKKRVAREREAKQSRRSELKAFFEKRAEAVRALEEYGEKAIPLVAEALREADLETGAVLVKIAAASPEDPRSHDAIKAWLSRRPFQAFVKDERVFGRIGRMKIPGILPVLDKALHRAHWRNRGALLRALFGARTPETTPELASILQRFIDKGDRVNNEVALNFLAVLLRDRNLRDADQREVIDKISKMIWNPAYKNLTPQIAAALGRCGHEAALEPLTDLLDHSDGRVVLTSIKALGSLGKKARPAAVRISRFLAARFHAPLRIAAVESLGRIGSEDAVWPLIDVLYEREISQQLRKIVVRSLKRITGKSLGIDGVRWANWWEQEQRRREGSQKD